jgi:hypothetical protein
MEDDWPIDEKAAEDAELKAWLVAGGEGGMGVIGAVNHRVAGINTIPTGDPATEVLCARALEHLARIRLREGTLGQSSSRAKAEPKPEWSQEDHERYEAAAYQTLQARIHRKGADQVMAEVIAETTEDLFERRAWSSAFYERLNDYEEEDLPA